MRARPASLALAVLVAVLGPLAACGGDDSGAATTTEGPTTTSTLPVMPADFDWWQPVKVPLGHGWTLAACTEPDPDEDNPGQHGRLCATHQGGRQAVVKFFRFDAPPDGDLNAHAARFVQDFIADRRQGCGAEYRVTAEKIEPVDAPDGAARRYGFRGGATGSPDTERTVQWAGIRGDALEIVSVSGYDPGSCVTPIGEGTLQDLTDLIPGVDELVRAAGMPGPKPGT